MRHRNQGKKFGRMKGPRRAFFKSLAKNLVQHERIETSETRAKELRRIVERLVTHAKKQNIAALRLLSRYLPKQEVFKIYHEIAPRYKERKGGYTRVIKLSKTRKHDNSKRAVIEFV